MFGYVRPLKGELKVWEYERFNASYCGLCCALDRRYGWTARFLLNYDLAFFAASASGVAGETRMEKRRCAANPFKRKCVMSCSPSMALAADLNVILAYMKLEDDVSDDGGILRKLARLWMRHHYKKAVTYRPKLAERVRESIETLNALERERSAQVDVLADAFASILDAAGRELDDGFGEMLYHIGRFVYLIDAADDLERDRKNGAFNAVAQRYKGRDDPDLRSTLALSLEAAYLASGRLDFGMAEGFVENVVFLGLPAVMNSVLDGKWKQRRRRDGSI